MLDNVIREVLLIDVLMDIEIEKEDVIVILVLFNFMVFELD